MSSMLSNKSGTSVGLSGLRRNSDHDSNNYYNSSNNDFNDDEESEEGWSDDSGRDSERFEKEIGKRQYAKMVPPSAIGSGSNHSVGSNGSSGRKFNSTIKNGSGSTTVKLNGKKVVVGLPGLTEESSVVYSDDDDDSDSGIGLLNGSNRNQNNRTAKNKYVGGGKSGIQSISGNGKANKISDLINSFNQSGNDLGTSTGSGGGSGPFTKKIANTSSPLSYNSANKLTRNHNHQASQPTAPTKDNSSAATITPLKNPFPPTLPSANTTGAVTGRAVIGSHNTSSVALPQSDPFPMSDKMSRFLSNNTFPDDKNGDDDDDELDDEDDEDSYRGGALGATPYLLGMGLVGGGGGGSRSTSSRSSNITGSSLTSSSNLGSLPAKMLLRAESPPPDVSTLPATADSSPNKLNQPIPHPALIVDTGNGGSIAGIGSGIGGRSGSQRSLDLGRRRGSGSGYAPRLGSGSSQGQPQLPQRSTSVEAPPSSKYDDDDDFDDDYEDDGFDDVDEFDEDDGDDDEYDDDGEPQTYFENHRDTERADRERRDREQRERQPQQASVSLLDRLSSHSSSGIANDRVPRQTSRRSSLSESDEIVDSMSFEFDEEEIIFDAEDSNDYNKDSHHAFDDEPVRYGKKRPPPPEATPSKLDAVAAGYAAAQRANQESAGNTASMPDTYYTDEEYQEGLENATLVELMRNGSGRNLDSSGHVPKTLLKQPEEAPSHSINDVQPVAPKKNRSWFGDMFGGLALGGRKKDSPPSPVQQVPGPTTTPSPSYATAPSPAASPAQAVGGLTSASVPPAAPPMAAVPPPPAQYCPPMVGGPLGYLQSPVESNYIPSQALQSPPTETPGSFVKPRATEMNGSIPMHQQLIIPPVYGVGNGSDYEADYYHRHQLAPGGVRDIEAPPEQAAVTAPTHAVTAGTASVYSESEKRNRCTITWLIVLLACALVCLAALAGGISGAMLYRKTAEQNSTSGGPVAGGGISSGGSATKSPGVSVSTTAPTSSPGGLTESPTTACVPNPFAGVFCPTPSPGSSNTIAPGATSNSTSALLSVISTYAPDKGASIKISGSPQNLAFQSLVNDRLTSLSNARIVQRYAMRVFFFSTGGPTSWTDSSGWLTTEDECTWYSTATSSVCTADVLNTLEFTENGLTGTLPSELSMLTGLNRLYIKSSPGTQGLTGSIPTLLGNLPMQTLVLDNNQFNSAMPSTLFANWGSSLQIINIISSLLTGSLPDVTTLTSCSNFQMDYNNFTGPLPSGLPSMTNLVQLSLTFNEFTGTIPSNVGSLNQVKGFYLGHNKIGGTIPTSLGIMTMLQGGLDLSHNDLTGTIPSEIDLLSNLRILLLNSNQLAGSVPDLSALTSLSEFRVDNNSLTGAISSGTCSALAGATSIYADCAQVNCTCCTTCCTYGTPCT